MTRLQRFRAAVERLFSPDYGTCKVCNRPWNRVEPHSVTYETTWYPYSTVQIPGVIFPAGSSRGVFAICEGCWPTLTVDERVAIMRSVLGDREVWPEIEQAIRVAA